MNTRCILWRIGGVRLERCSMPAAVDLAKCSSCERTRVVPLVAKNDCHCVSRIESIDTAYLQRSVGKELHDERVALHRTFHHADAKEAHHIRMSMLSELTK